MIRYGAIETLGKIGKKAMIAVPQLRNMAANHEDAAIRSFSKIAIERITGKYPYDIKDWEPSSD